jgi:pyruvate carboxylase subunit B
MASVLEVCRNGADIIDVAMEPLSWGMVHPDVIAVQAMLRDAGFEVADIDMNAYMEARSLTQKFMDDFLGYFIEPKNKISTSLLLGCGLPGGMMGSMMADLKGIHSYLNKTLEKKGQPTLNEDELLVKLFNEVEAVWPMVGTPGLVTPFSQYVKNIALMNVRAEIEGKPRFTYMEQNQWDMILGKCGRLPGPLAPEIIELAKEKGFEFFDGVPQENYPDELPKYRQMMEEKGWDVGPDEEELFELAMHERQYIDYKEGRAKQNFNRELEAAMLKKQSGGGAAPQDRQQIIFERVRKMYPEAQPVVAPVSGDLLWEIAVDGEKSMPKPVGTRFKEGDTICFVSTYYGMEPVPSLFDGQLLETVAEQGQKVNKGDVIAFIK